MITHTTRASSTTCPRAIALLLAIVLVPLAGCTYVRGYVNLGRDSASFVRPRGDEAVPAASPVEGARITVTAVTRAGDRKLLRTTSKDDGSWAVRLSSDIDLTHRLRVVAERQGVYAALWEGFNPPEGQIVFMTVRPVGSGTIVR